MSESTPNAEDLSLLKRQMARLEARLVEERESTLRLWTGVCLFLTALAFIVPLQTFEEGSVYLVTAPLWLYLLAAAGLFLVWFAVLSHFGSSMQFSPAILMLGTGAFAMLLASFHARRLD